MTQTWNIPPTELEVLGTIVKTNIVNALNALRSMFSGTSEPNVTAGNMLFAHEGTGEKVIKKRNSANSAWVDVAPLDHDWCHESYIQEIGGLSASKNLYLAAPKDKTWKIERVRIISDTSSSGSDGSNNWSVQIRNKTAGVDLLSAARSTDVDEIAADTPWDVDADQNQTIAVDDVLQLQITKNGTATSLTRVSIQLEYTRSVAA